MTTTINQAPARTSVWAKAKAVIEQRGWYQGHYLDPDWSGPRGEAPVCLLGALAVVLYRDPEAGPDVTFPADADHDVETLGWRLVDLLDLDPDNGLASSEWAVSRWNDDPARTREEIYALLDHAEGTARAA